MIRSATITGILTAAMVAIIALAVLLFAACDTEGDTCGHGYTCYNVITHDYICDHLDDRADEISESFRADMEAFFRC